MLRKFGHCNVATAFTRVSGRHRFQGQWHRSFESSSKASNAHNAAVTLPGHGASISHGAITAEASALVEKNLNSVAQIVPYDGMWGAMKSFPKRRPFLFNLLLAGTLMPLADYNIQLSEEGSWDQQRSFFFMVFGLYNGLAWWVVYVKAFSKLFPSAVRFSNLSWSAKLKDRSGQVQLVGQMMLDLLLYVPMCFFPSFYTFKATLKGETLQDAFNKWKNNFFEDNCASVAFWVPGDLITFAVPAWMRMPVSHAVSYSWNLMLSWGRGDA